MSQIDPRRVQAASALPALTEAQTNYVLRMGKRFALGNVQTGDIRANVSIIEVYNGWLEFHYENDSGQPQGTARAIEFQRFRVLIVRELESLDTKECERRGYR